MAVFRTEEEWDWHLGIFTRQEMGSKLEISRRKGRGGWSHPTECTNARLIEMLKEHLEKGDFIDVVNLAAMIHYRKERGIEK